MPIIKETSSGVIETYGVPKDIADANTTTTTASGYGTEVTSVNVGSISFPYQYDIITTQKVVGNGYVSSGSSSIKCSSSVALLSRNFAFTALRNSSLEMSSCATNIAQRGICALYSSTATVKNCVSCLSEVNYLSANCSSLILQASASMLPFRYGVDTQYDSSVSLQDFETVTANFAGAFAIQSSNIPVPTHFRSIYNSFVENTSYSLTTKPLASGFSGPEFDSKPLNLVWSQIAFGVGIASGSTAATNILGTPVASYRYVPFSHSLDWSNVYPASLVAASTAINTPGFVSMLTRPRNNYSSVKPPATIFKAEDNSGLIGTNTGLTGDFSIFDLINSL
jgi:hypothetical protein